LIIYLCELRELLIHAVAKMPPRKRAKSSAPVTEVSTLWTHDVACVTAIAPDGNGNVFASTSTSIHKISDGVETVVAGGEEGGYADGPQGMFSDILGFAVDAGGCLIVVEGEDGNRIRKVALDGQVSTVAGDPEGSAGYTDGQGAEARFNNPDAVAVDSDGNVLVADSRNHCIRKVAPDGTVSTLAGTPEEAGCQDGPAHEAGFNGPQGVAVDQEGNVFVADTGNGSIRKISREGAVSTLAGSAEGESGHVDGAGDTARFDDPVGLAVDADGTIVVADNENQSIRKVTPEGVVSTLAGPTASERGNPRSSRTGYADGPANTARFNDLFAVAIDADGNVLVADVDAVRMITHTGLSRGVAVPRWPVGKPALAANLLALLDDERFADVSFGAQALRALHALTLRNRRACGTYCIPYELRC
jgi:sugar lactone lactonase YvrE